jgi:hypothetical protein
VKPILALLVLTAASASAQSWDGDQSALTLPSTVTARTSDLSAGLLAKTPVERLKPQVTRDPSGTTVTAELVKKGGGENTLWEMRWEPGEAWGPGTWVAFRDGLGRLREVRIIILEGSDGSDNKLAQPGTWVRLVPQGRGSRLDLFLAGRLVTGGWTVPGSLLDVMASSDTWLWESTPDVDWASVLPRRRWEDDKVETVRAAMRKALSTMTLSAETVWLSDPRSTVNGTTATGAPWGQWMTLTGGDAGRGLGPWGVTLWATDGVLRGWKAAPMTWKALQRPRIVLPGYSEAFVPDPSDDPALAVNWIRNLGLAVQETLYPTRALIDTSSDVRDLPFVAPADASGGYDVGDVPALFHLLAVTRPGQAYLICLSAQAAQNGMSAAVTFREPAVLLPWVGQDNRVRVAVYGGPKEQTWDQWVADFPGSSAGARTDHLMLTALPLPAQTMLPRLPLR